MPPFYPYTPNAMAPTPTHNCTHSPVFLCQPTQIQTRPAISYPTPCTAMATSFTVGDILHRMSAADTPAQPTSTLEFTVKTADSGSDSGGLSTPDTIGIIAGVIVFLVILGFIVVKRWNY